MMAGCPRIASWTRTVAPSSTDGTTVAGWIVTTGLYRGGGPVASTGGADGSSRWSAATGRRLILAESWAGSGSPAGLADLLCHPGGPRQSNLLSKPYCSAHQFARAPSRTAPVRASAGVTERPIVPISISGVSPGAAWRCWSSQVGRWRTAGDRSSRPSLLGQRQKSDIMHNWRTALARARPSTHAEVNPR